MIFFSRLAVTENRTGSNPPHRDGTPRVRGTRQATPTDHGHPSTPTAERRPTTHTVHHGQADASNPKRCNLGRNTEDRTAPFTLVEADVSIS